MNMLPGSLGSISRSVHVRGDGLRRRTVQVIWRTQWFSLWWKEPPHFARNRQTRSSPFITAPDLFRFYPYSLQLTHPTKCEVDAHWGEYNSRYHDNLLSYWTYGLQHQKALIASVVRRKIYLVLPWSKHCIAIHKSQCDWTMRPTLLFHYNVVVIVAYILVVSVVLLPCWQKHIIVGVAIYSRWLFAPLSTPLIRSRLGFFFIIIQKKKVYDVILYRQKLGIGGKRWGRSRWGQNVSIWRIYSTDILKGNKFTLILTQYELWINRRQSFDPMASSIQLEPICQDHIIPTHKIYRTYFYL